MKELNQISTALEGSKTEFLSSHEMISKRIEEIGRDILGRIEGFEVKDQVRSLVQQFKRTPSYHIVDKEVIDELDKLNVAYGKYNAIANVIIYNDLDKLEIEKIREMQADALNATVLALKDLIKSYGQADLSTPQAEVVEAPNAFERLRQRIEDLKNGGKKRMGALALTALASIGPVLNLITPAMASAAETANNTPPTERVVDGKIAQRQTREDVIVDTVGGEQQGNDENYEKGNSANSIEQASSIDNGDVATANINSRISNGTESTQDWIVDTIPPIQKIALNQVEISDKRINAIIDALKDRNLIPEKIDGENYTDQDIIDDLSRAITEKGGVESGLVYYIKLLSGTPGDISASKVASQVINEVNGNQTAQTPIRQVNSDRAAQTPRSQGNTNTQRQQPGKFEVPPSGTKLIPLSVIFTLREVSTLRLGPEITLERGKFEVHEQISQGRYGTVILIEDFSTGQGRFRFVVSNNGRYYQLLNTQVTRRDGSVITPNSVANWLNREQLSGQADRTYNVAANNRPNTASYDQAAADFAQKRYGQMSFEDIIISNTVIKLYKVNGPDLMGFFRNNPDAQSLAGYVAKYVEHLFLTDPDGAAKFITFMNALSLDSKPESLYLQRLRDAISVLSQISDGSGQAIYSRKSMSLERWGQLVRGLGLNENEAAARYANQLGASTVDKKIRDRTLKELNAINRSLGATSDITVDIDKKSSFAPGAVPIGGLIIGFSSRSEGRVAVSSLNIEQKLALNEAVKQILAQGPDKRYGSQSINNILPFVPGILSLIGARFPLAWYNQSGSELTRTITQNSEIKQTIYDWQNRLVQAEAIYNAFQTNPDFVQNYKRGIGEEGNYNAQDAVELAANDYIGQTITVNINGRQTRLVLTQDQLEALKSYVEGLNIAVQYSRGTSYTGTNLSSRTLGTVSISADSYLTGVNQIGTSEAKQFENSIRNEINNLNSYIGNNGNIDVVNRRIFASKFGEGKLSSDAVLALKTGKSTNSKIAVKDIRGYIGPNDVGAGVFRNKKNSRLQADIVPDADPNEIYRVISINGQDFAFIVECHNFIVKISASKLKIEAVRSRPENLRACAAFSSYYSGTLPDSYNGAKVAPYLIEAYTGDRSQLANALTGINNASYVRMFEIAKYIFGTKGLPVHRTDIETDFSDFSRIKGDITSEHKEFIRALNNLILEGHTGLVSKILNGYATSQIDYGEIVEKRNGVFGISLSPRSLGIGFNNDSSRLTILKASNGYVIANLYCNIVSQDGTIVYVNQEKMGNSGFLYFPFGPGANPTRPRQTEQTPTKQPQTTPSDQNPNLGGPNQGVNNNAPGIQPQTAPGTKAPGTTGGPNQGVNNNAPGIQPQTAPGTKAPGTTGGPNGFYRGGFPEQNPVINIPSTNIPDMTVPTF